MSDPFIIDGKAYVPEKLAFATPPDRGYTAEAYYIKQPNAGDAVICICKDAVPIRFFVFPAYKIWNIAAHFRDIVDSEIAKDAQGYNVAGSDGLGGGVRFPASFTA